LRLATVASLSDSLAWRDCNFSAFSSALLGAVLNLLVAVEVVGRVTVREAVVDAVGRVVVVGALVVGLVEETVLMRDPVVDAILERRSKVEVGLAGAPLLVVVPARDIRLAVPEIPRFSSPELATDRDFSSAELRDGRER
jgi:hypothetical protein